MGFEPARQPSCREGQPMKISMLTSRQDMMMVQMMRMPRGAVQVFGRRSSEINKSALLASPAAWESEGGRKDILDYIAIY